MLPNAAGVTDHFELKKGSYMLARLYTCMNVYIAMHCLVTTVRSFITYVLTIEWFEDDNETVRSKIVERNNEVSNY